MEEDPCNTVCTPPHSRSHQYSHSSSVSTSSQSCADEQKNQVRRSDRLQHPKDCMHDSTETEGEKTVRRGHGSSSFPTKRKMASNTMQMTVREHKDAVQCKKMSRMKIQSRSHMSEGEDESRCNEDHTCSALQMQDCNGGDTEPELEVAECRPKISGPPQSPTPLKQWVIGPLLQSFKSKIASFTEIVMSPVQLFKSNVLLPNPSDIPNPNLDSVCDSHLNTNDGVCSGTKTEEKVVTENQSIHNCLSTSKVHEGVEREVYTRISTRPYSTLNNSEVVEEGKSVAQKPLAVKKLNFDKGTKVENCQEQDELQTEQNAQLQITPNICTLQHNNLPSEFPFKNLKFTTNNQLTSVQVQGPTEEAAVYSNFKEQHNALEDMPKVAEVNTESCPVSPSMYCTQPDIFSQSKEVKDGDLRQLGFLENLNNVESRTFSALCVLQDETKQDVCTTCISLPGKCSSPAVNCSDKSDQSLAKDVAGCRTRDKSRLDQPQITGRPLLRTRLKGHAIKEGNAETIVRDERQKWTDIQTAEYQRAAVGSRWTNGLKKGRGKALNTRYHVLEQNPQEEVDVAAAPHAEAILLSSGNRRPHPFRRKGSIQGKKTRSIKPKQDPAEAAHSTEEHAANCRIKSALHVTNGNGDNCNVSKHTDDTDRNCIRRGGRSGRGESLRGSPSAVNNTRLSDLGSPSVFECSVLSPDCSAPVSAMVTITIERENELERISTSETTNAKISHLVPNKESQYSRLRKRSSNPVNYIGFTVNCKNSQVVQKGTAPKGIGSKVNKGITDSQSRVPKGQWGSRRSKQRRKNCNRTTKNGKCRMFQNKDAEDEKSVVKDLGGRAVQSEGLEKIGKDGATERTQQSGLLDNAKLYTKVGSVPNVSETLPSLSEDMVHIKTDLNLSSSMAATASEELRLVYESTFCGAAADQFASVSDTCHKSEISSRKCMAGHGVGKKESLTGKQEEETMASACATSQFAKKCMNTRDEAECLTVRCMHVRKRGLTAQPQEKMGEADSQKKRAKILKSEGEWKGAKGKMEERLMKASQSELAGSDSLSTRLSRSYSCPEIPLVPLDHSWNTPLCPSFPHSRLCPPSLSQRAPVQHSWSPAKRTRRHTVCSMEVERELAPLCLRKEVYPAGSAGLYCTSSGSRTTSRSCIPLSTLASCFLSSPLAFLSQKQHKSSGVLETSGSSSGCDMTPSYSPVTTSSHTSPASPSDSHLFPSFRPCTLLKAGKSSTSLSSLCSISSQPSLEVRDSASLQEEQNIPSMQLVASDAQEERALSDSEVKVDVTKQRIHGKVSRIKIRKTPPKPPANLTPMGLPKPVRLKKKEFSVEEIYTNKNFCKPPEGRLETIFEVPVSCRDGSLAVVSQRRFKRLVVFPELGVARKPKKPLVGSSGGASWKSGFGRTRRGGPSPSLQDLDLLLCTKLSQLDSWIAFDQASVLA